MKTKSLRKDKVNIITLGCSKNMVDSEVLNRLMDPLLHLLRKAFHPGVPPMPLLQVDTSWKFRDMVAFRDRMASAPDAQAVWAAIRDWSPTS